MQLKYTYAEYYNTEQNLSLPLQVFMTSANIELWDSIILKPLYRNLLFPDMVDWSEESDSESDSDPSELKKFRPENTF